MSRDERRHSILAVVAENTVVLARVVATRSGKPEEALYVAQRALDLLVTLDSRQHHAYLLARDVASVGLDTQLVVVGHAPFEPEVLAGHLVREVASVEPIKSYCGSCFERELGELLKL